MWITETDIVTKISSGQENLTEQKVSSRESQTDIVTLEGKCALARFPIASDNSQEEVLQKIGFPPSVLRPSSSFLCSARCQFSNR